MDRPHSNQYNMDDVNNNKKYVHTITCSIENEAMEINIHS